MQKRGALQRRSIDLALATLSQRKQRRIGNRRHGHGQGARGAQPLAVLSRPPAGGLRCADGNLRRAGLEAQEMERLVAAYRQERINGFEETISDRLPNIDSLCVSSWHIS